MLYNNYEIVSRKIIKYFDGTLISQLQTDKREAEDIITEEQLLDQEQSVYYSLQSMLTGIDPFHKLWHTAYDFYEGYEKW